MAIKKITELTADSTVRPSDVTVTVDLDANITKKATWSDIIAGLNGIVATITGSNFSGPVTASAGFNTAGQQDVTLAHSGAIVRRYDAYLKAFEGQGTILTTPGSPNKAIFSFVSGVNGKTYATDIIVTTQSTTTTGSGYFKYSAHYLRSADVIELVGSVDTVKTSYNHHHLTCSLTSSDGNIVVSGSQGISAESFRWGCFLRAQEQGS